MNQVLKKVSELIEKIHSSSQLGTAQGVRGFVNRIDLGHQTLTISIRHGKMLHDGTDDVLHTIEVPLALKHRGVETHLVIGHVEEIKANVDRHLIATIAKARCWFDTLCSEPGASINLLAEREGIPPSEVSRRLPLAFLSLRIVRTVLQGQQPIELTASTLLRLPELSMDWDEQARLLGFPAT